MAREVRGSRHELVVDAGDPHAAPAAAYNRQHTALALRGIRRRQLTEIAAAASPATAVWLQPCGMRDADTA